MKAKKKRIISWVLVVAMLLGLMPGSILAAEVIDGDNTGLCQHHPVHTAECGYSEPSPGAECTHQHTEACYESITHCTHVHGAECFSHPDPFTAADFEGDGSVPDSLALSNEGELGSGEEPDVSEGESGVPGEEPGVPGGEPGISGGEPTACTHQCTVESGCLEQVLNCPHVHEESCGYQPPSQGSPCTFVCESCKGEKPKEEVADWPEAPQWPQGPGTFSDREMDGGMGGDIYGRPQSAMSVKALADAQAASLALPVAEDPEKEIPEAEVDHFTVIYVNGEAYKGGDLTVMEGDNFSYLVSWAPNPEAIGEAHWGDGSWFEAVIFTVPGLNLGSYNQVSLMINGIKVGEYSLNYNRTSGEMTYKVVFNRYIQLFTPDSIMAYFQGSGKFVDANADGEISLGEHKGNLTINPRPTVPDIPEVPEGVGWKPAKAPDFNDNSYGFGKGIKWDSSGDPNRDPEIEWRIVFLEQLQKIQRDFLEGKGLPESNGYILIEDTLDANQQFVCAPEGDEHKYGDAPFFLELPVVVPGTGNILNGVSNVGNGNYDGPGEIASLFKGNNFTEIPGESAVTSEEIRAVEEQVEKTPLSWTVTKDRATGQQTLLINAGKLGTTNPIQGVTWGKSSNQNWPVKELEKKIRECENKIRSIKNGNDSPITLLDQRMTALFNLLNMAVNLPQNQEHMENLKAMVAEWREDFLLWSENEQVSPLQPLEKQDPITGEWTVSVPLPRKELIEQLSKYTAKQDGTILENTQEYQNYLTSLNNLLKDQRTYLANQQSYGKDWEAAKEYYEKALEFYDTEAVYGFVLKVRSRSINTSAGTYSNTVSIDLDDKSWTANDSGQITFSSGIVGNYGLGDVVLQKADAYYDTGDTVPDMQAVDQDKAGLAGATFQVYCGDAEHPEEPPEPTKENRAHFLDKDASANGDTYRYTHTGTEHSEGLLHGEIDKLTVNQDGKLVISKLTEAHPHWLQEIEAPRGYYLDQELIRVDSETGQVNYQMLPNVSRSVLLYKRDSYSGNPVEGAEFALYKVKDGQEEAITGFEKKSLKDHQTYVRAENGTEKLKTNEAGELCIHGLDAGSYVLKEVAAAPGYLTPAETELPKFEFTLKENLPVNDDSYDENYHLLLNTETQPLYNEPGVAKLSVTKTGIGDALLADAGFALFRFTGTEAQWQDDPDKEALWTDVDLKSTQEEGKYFKTSNEIAPIKVKGEGSFNGKTLQAAMTSAQGVLQITDIPVGHYSISEVKAPETYQRDYRSFYFTVDKDTVGKDLQLYTEPEEKNPLTENTLKNYQEKVQLALVKYDADLDAPEIGGDRIESKDGWQYTDSVLSENNQAPGLEGAVYKLFMRRGAASGKINPDLEQLKTEEMLDNKEPYDICVAKGTTGEGGVLKLSQMKGINGNLLTDGLNPEEYYMIEITPPQGYLLDQSPVYFSLNGDVFPEEDSMTPGLVKLAKNHKLTYGLRLTKTDEEDQSGISGAGFQVRKGEELLSFTGSNGVYQQAAAGDTAASDTVFTGADGTLIVTGLEAAATYTFKETKVPQGYDPTAVNDFTLKTADSEESGVLEGHVLFQKEEKTVTNKRLKGAVTLHKRATETMEDLSGAKFTLYQTIVTEIKPGDPDYDSEHPDATRSEDIELQTGRTGEDGTLTFENLEWGSYYLQETEAPKGYMLNQVKLNFTIHRNSFDQNGKPIVVQFPMVINRKGQLGEAVLYKADADDTTKRLPGAHFYLEKYVSTDAAGKEIWVGYGKGMYETDQEGKISFLLPPGEYRLLEMKAPDGYVLEGMKEVRFTIAETEDNEKPPLVIIDDGDQDGVVTNRAGEAGVYVKKTLGVSDTPVKGVTFQIGWVYTDQNLVSTYEPLYFAPLGEGEYTYTADTATPGATTELVTGADGEIYVLMPETLEPPENPEHAGKSASLYCREIKAPDGLQVDEKVYPVTLNKGIFTEVHVADQLKTEVAEDLAITIHKTDGKSKLGLAGAEFTLYWYTGTGEENQNSHIQIGTGVTDEKGTLVFDHTNTEELPGLMVGETYHIVETKAPDGYVLDETHHEITLDGSHFDEDFHFTGAVLELNNGQIQGSVTLKKVAQGDPEKVLTGAEFELLRKVEAADPTDVQWEHYGEDRYVTNEEGILLIEDLPYGSYQLVERAAPLGYLLQEPAPALTFQITENSQKIDLGPVENPVDPNPVRDVYVKKVAAHEKELGLPGAEFQLYQMNETGEYHLIQQSSYVTDASGGFVIQDLPAGMYALKEIQAPSGYELPQQTMTYFSVKAEDKEVVLVIENEKSESENPTPPDPGEPEKPMATPTPIPTGEPEKPTPTPTGEPGEPTPTPTGEPEEPTPTPTGEPGKPTPTPTGEPGKPTPTPTAEPTPTTQTPNVPNGSGGSPGSGGSGDGGSTGTQPPKTGDGSQPFLWWSLLCLAGFGIASCMWKKREKKS